MKVSLKAYLTYSIVRTGKQSQFSCLYRYSGCKKGFLLIRLLFSPLLLSVRKAHCCRVQHSSVDGWSRKVPTSSAGHSNFALYLQCSICTVPESEKHAFTLYNVKKMLLCSLAINYRYYFLSFFRRNNNNNAYIVTT